ncbi:Type II secretion system protein F [Marinobacterium sp. xm-g-59]|uniref:type II secretion system F family protein n=1 Tax=Marinobacterium sp. xm-g-59 TaxID=2497748 RepID=UPI00156A1290|nr:type II secretion system F family protein [Marinobacterium sp. xm-g-59]NRP96120.1 Type II secretion system protein F [Marinobacterium sp. xm-g-59]
MASFKYTVLDELGRQHKGVMTAESLAGCRTALREQYSVILDTEELSQKQNVESAQSLIKRLSQKQLKGLELAMILRQLATLLDAGMPIDQALKTMVANAETAKQQVLIQSWLDGLLEGLSLAKAMNLGASLPPQDVLAAVEVAEQTGHLAKVLERMADEQELALDNQRTLKGALAYPILLLVVASAVLIFIVTNIVPKITSVFAKQKAELPFVTELVIGVSDFFVNYGLYLGVFLGLACLAFIVAMQRESFSYSLDALVLKIPKLGYWIVLANFANWCRNLALLLESGVPVTDAMRIANETLGNKFLKSNLDLVARDVAQGETLRDSLSRQPYTPGFMLHLISSGEQSSRLSDMLSKVAAYYSKLLASSTDTLLKLLNPLLLILIAGVVMVIILGVITPIMQMNSMV